MIEQDIFRVVKTAFGLSATLRCVPVVTFECENTQAPFVVFGCSESGASWLTFTLLINSTYRGIAQVLGFNKEIKGLLEQATHVRGNFQYVFKEGKSSKNTLTFKAKRFKTGDE